MDSVASQPTDTGIKRFHLDWVIPTFIHPKTAIQTIVAQEKATWLTPMLLLSALVILAGLVAGPIRQDVIISSATIPDSFQYLSPDQQAQFMDAQSSQSSALFTYIFPIAGSLLGIWITWFLLGIVLHLSLTLTGSRAHSVRSYNLVAWTMLPFAVRQVVQILAMLFAHSLISAPGLSGFVTVSGGGLAFLSGILAQIDIYFIWQIALLLLGVQPLSGLTRAKAWGATAFSLAVLMLLMALPQLIGSLFSGITSGGGSFYG
ncbi:MAG TPA: YIP1 family protein [Longilinea sp.]|nr:YIP1 family protein [Longilinea sp.]